MILEISYQTQNIPAPFAFSVIMKLEISKEVKMHFELSYLDREDLSEQEILGEGFSLDDDLIWSGTLGNNWKEVLRNFSNLEMQNEPNEQFFLHIKIDDATAGFPNVENDIIIQELIQAAFERSGREEQLEIRFLKSEIQQVLSWDFAQRAASLDGLTFDWSLSYQLMELIYTRDFEKMKVLKQPINKSVMLGSEGWFLIEDQSVWTLVESIQARTEK